MDQFENQNKSKVLPFRDTSNYSLFSPSLRKKMEDGVSDLTEKPADVVQTIEQVICSTIIAVFRKWASNIGKQAGEKLSSLSSSNQ